MLNPSVDLPDAAGPSMAIMEGSFGGVIVFQLYTDTQTSRRLLFRTFGTVDISFIWACELWRDCILARIREQVITRPEDDGLVFHGYFVEHEPG